MERHREFIRIWFASASIEDVAAAIGQDRRYVQNLGAFLRRHGVMLPALRGRPNPGMGGQPRINWAELRSLAAELQQRRDIETAAAMADRYRRGA
jgi:hypothetical protein